jgi:hypothetical protein
MNDTGNYQAVLKLGECNKELYEIRKEMTEQHKKSEIDIFEEKNYLVINEILKKHTKRVYRDLCKKACDKDWYDLFQVTICELSRFGYPLFTAGGWNLDNLKRFIKEYIEEPSSVTRMEIGENLLCKENCACYNDKFIITAVKADRKDNIEFLIHNYNQSESFYYSGFISSLINKKFHLLPYFETRIIKGICTIDLYDIIKKKNNYNSEQFVFIIKKILQKSISNDDLNFALSCACKFSIYELVEYLIDQGAIQCMNCERSLDLIHTEDMQRTGLQF